MTEFIKIMLLLSVTLITACATTAGLLGFEQKTDKQALAEDCNNDGQLLKYRSTISGTLKSTPSRKNGQPSVDERVRLVSPAAVAAQSSDVFIADTAQKKIFKYDRATQTIASFADVPDMGG